MKETLDFLFQEFDGYDIFSHNGGKFDHLFVLKEYLEHSDEYTLGDIIPRGSSILTFTLCNSKGRSITFRDSIALLPFSLRKLTESFDVVSKKGEIDYEKITKITPELLAYLESDCRGLFEVIEKFYSQSLIAEVGGTYTVASQAFRVLRGTLDEDQWNLSPHLDATLRKSYFGGRVEIFRPIHSGPSDLYCYDVNSLYPSVMKGNIFPNGFLYKSNSFDEDDCGFFECDVSVPKSQYLPPLGILQNGKYIFPTGRYQGLFSVPEINYARETGCKIETGRGYLFSPQRELFDVFVAKLYRLKNKGKTEVERVIAKLLLNSCYGRFGLNRNREVLVFDNGRSGLSPIQSIICNGKPIQLASKPVELEGFSNVSVAAYVTAYARIHMHRIMREVQDTLYYTDTDSIFTTSKMPTSDKLGELKLESTSKTACFLLPKTYIAGDKIRMKGFSARKIQHFTYDDFVSALEGDMKLKINIEPKFATLKTALRLGEIVTMTNPSTREIRSRYDKRILIKKGKTYDSKPIHLG